TWRRQNDPVDSRRAERIRGKGDDVVRITDNIEPLALQLADDAADARTAHTNAGTNRVHVRIRRVNRDFGAIPRLPSRVFNDDSSVIDLGHFHFEQLDQQPGVRARDLDLWLLGAAVGADNDRLGPVVLAEALVFRLFRLVHHGFDVVAQV